MSDALSDIAKDERRGRAFNKFIGAVKEWVVNQSQENFNAAVKAAEEVDCVRGGYWGSGTNFQEKIRSCLTNLISTNEEVKKLEWVKFLYEISDSPHFKSLKALSPFAEEVLIFVDYGVGFVTIRGELEDVFGGLIRAREMKTYDCDRYFVALPKNSFKDKKVKVYWLNCGILGINGPRKPNEK